MDRGQQEAEAEAVGEKTQEAEAESEAEAEAEEEANGDHCCTTAIIICKIHFFPKTGSYILIGSFCQIQGTQVVQIFSTMPVNSKITGRQADCL